MAELSTGKNLLSADVEIKGSIKFQNELTIDGKIGRASCRERVCLAV